MEIRFKPLEVVILSLGLLFAGMLIGFIVKGHFTRYKGYLYLGMTLLPSLTMIMRRHYKKAPVSQPDFSWHLSGKTGIQNFFIKFFNPLFFLSV